MKEMQEIFETFKPVNSIVREYVDYYYLDIKPNNIVNEFQCFPHFNNTISLYKSHVKLDTGEMIFEDSAKSFQIFTPIREKILSVKQSGPVYRIVIVFHAFGIQQFYRNLNFADYVMGESFFNEQELGALFSTENTGILTELLDCFLQKRFQKFDNSILEQTIKYIFKNYEDFAVTKIAGELGISRQHLNRVFQSHLGVSVKKFHEIVVFRQTINQKLFKDPNESFTRLAHGFNYNDQSHFNKTYKILTENSPKSFFSKGTVLGREDTFWHLQP